MKQILASVLMTLMLAAFVFAQTPPRFGRPPIGNPPGDGLRGQRGQAPDPTTRLKAALNLTDAQVEAIKALNQTRRTRADAIMTEIKAKREALDALLDAATPSATNVGNAAIALRASEKKIAAERDWFITELKKLLTGDQQQKLDTLLAANAGIPLFGGPGRGRGPRE